MTPTEFTFEEVAPQPVPPAPFAPGAVVTPADAVLAALAEAEADAAAIRGEARAEGLEQGRAAALAAAAPALEALEAAAAAVEAERAALALRLEEQAVDLAFGLAEKILAGAIAVQPDLVIEAVRGALRGLVERERITVLLHPEDLDVVREAMTGLQATLGGIEHCEVQAERRVSRGGAVVRTPEGDIDARIETKLERAREVVERALS